MSFGSYDPICHMAALPLCPLVGSNPITGGIGIQPACYARTISIANTIIFSGAASFVHIGALIMATIMLLHVRSKFTAVGRKEIQTFFYSFMLLTVFSLVLDAGVVPPGSSALPWFVAVQIGLAGSTCMSLLINGFVGFQIYEDGTRLSVWLLRVCSLIWFLISFVVALLTFKGWAGLGPNNTTGLFVVSYLFNGLFLAIYVVMSLLLVVNTIQDRWPLGDIAFGVFFFVSGQVILYVVSVDICIGAAHYIDGLFIATITNLLAVMMIYKFWDSITKEDLEFSVGMKASNWEVKEPMIGSSYNSVGGGGFVAPSGYSAVDRYDHSPVRGSVVYKNGYDDANRGSAVYRHSMAKDADASTIDLMQPGNRHSAYEP